MTTQQFDNIPALIQASNATMEIDRRTQLLPVEVRGVTVDLPYVLGPSGPAFDKNAWEAAKNEAMHLFPERSGSYRFDDIDSLNAWADRYITRDTVAYVLAPDSSGKAGEIVVIVDDLPAAARIQATDEATDEATARAEDGAHRRLRASVPIALHPRLLAWLQPSDTELSAEEFCDLLDRGSDELASAEVITMAQNLEVSNEKMWKRTVDPVSGRVALAAEDATKTTKVPRSFGFFVPVFEFDDPINAMNFTCRLSLKVKNGRPSFTYEVVDFHSRLAAAMKTLKVQIARSVPVVFSGPVPR